MTQTITENTTITTPAISSTPPTTDPANTRDTVTEQLTGITESHSQPAMMGMVLDLLSSLGLSATVTPTSGEETFHTL